MKAIENVPYAGPEMIPDHPKVDYSDVPPIPEGVVLPNPENSLKRDEVERDGDR